MTSTPGLSVYDQSFLSLMSQEGWGCTDSSDAEHRRPADHPGPGRRDRTAAVNDRRIKASRHLQTAYSLVELPGIEPGPKIGLTCGNAQFEYSKRRETTRSDLRIHRKVLMASTRRFRAQCAVEYGVKVRSRQYDISQRVLIGQQRRQVAESARIPVLDLPRLLSLVDQIGHQLHCVGATAVHNLGEEKSRTPTMRYVIRQGRHCFT